MPVVYERRKEGLLLTLTKFEPFRMAKSHVRDITNGFAYLRDTFVMNRTDVTDIIAIVCGGFLLFVTVPIVALIYGVNGFLALVLAALV